MVTIVNEELLIVKISGVFDSRALQALCGELNEIERFKSYPKRFSDIDTLTDITVTSNDILFFKSCRGDPAIKVYTAFCGFTDFQYGMARMFQSLIESEQHKIEIFKDIDSAAEWLKVDADLLKKKPQ